MADQHETSSYCSSSDTSYLFFRKCVTNVLGDAIDTPVSFVWKWPSHLSNNNNLRRETPWSKLSATLSPSSIPSTVESNWTTPCLIKGQSRSAVIVHLLLLLFPVLAKQTLLFRWMNCVSESKKNMRMVNKRRIVDDKRWKHVNNIIGPEES